MNRVIEKLDQLLLPEKLRRHITFRLATLFVAVVTVGSLALDRLIGPGSPPEATAQIRKLVHSPGFLTFHALVLALGFWLIYRTREKKQYYRFRVLFYGMLLGGLVGEIMDFLLPLRH
jgi:hypothetical protein